MSGLLTLLGLLALLMVLPVKLAADFTDGENTELATTFGASIAGLILAFIVFRLLNGGLLGTLMAYGSLLTVYIYMLRIPARTVFGFAVIVFALQLAVIAALLSFGFNIGRLLLPLLVD